MGDIVLKEHTLENRSKLKYQDDNKTNEFFPGFYVYAYP